MNLGALELKRTYLAPEEHAYPNGGQTRKCRAIYPDGVVRVVWAGIADTYFSIPAHGRLKGKYLRGYLSVQDHPDLPDYGEFVFHVYKDEKKV